jgi:hypothetical protein
MIIELQVSTIDEAKVAAAKYSLAHPNVYVRVGSCFGAYLVAEKRLHVFAPTDYSLLGINGYWKRGKFKPFTAAQKQADQDATPTMG